MEASKRGDQFVVRLPSGLRGMIKRTAQKNMRSMNSEIVFHLEKAVRDLSLSAGDETTGDPDEKEIHK
ncbi:hypothetical protein ASD54_10955 [Rhizobium sp. Root149]|uniref:Arc family DNA-binding protein n=1 Tax=Rhizobium sp. Root149 TaxID=1736473 RepID=UPI00071465FE|nr:Arc family DNA-binding protein [Rhizobium sp. Root149]KQZ50720.1 hypothetical protein ASD54_10955 [Rhizobium sp. Root149]